MLARSWRQSKVERIHGALLAAVVAVPLTSADGWQVLSYRRIPPNQVTFADGGIEIAVDRSAGPVLYPLPSPLTITRLDARGQVVRGSLDLPSGRLQGQKGYDDFVMRVGVVETGERRLGLWERLFAADWLKKLFALAPPDAGISRVRFFNVAYDASTIGLSRRHPSSDLVHEEIVVSPDASGGFVIAVALDPAPEVAAVWLAADGDDTGSRFTVRLSSLVLTSR
jgi:hypothetical protein